MGYTFNVFYSEEDDGYIATVSKLHGCSAYGKTEEEAIKEAKVAMELWLECANKEGRRIPKPQTQKEYSGRILARIHKSLHRQLIEKARAEHVSVNQLLVHLLSKQVTHV
ncbi:MAG TPA: type II toxin-antitoxin system HicB family antitoxin [Nitrospirae bacterium]|nr:type II toxin-antitoxin system HicB family antitoxin [Nitrospirota bacterium]